jgi:hypothetical protein
MSRHAIVIGSNGPSNAGQLRFAYSDAYRIASALKQGRCGFDVHNLSDISDPQIIEKYVAEITEACFEDDTLILYFSGHGFVERGGLLLMLDNTDIKKPLSTALHADSIVRALRFCPAKRKLLVLDCCHAGMVFADGRFKSGIGSRVADFVGTEDQEFDSFIALMASDRLEKARELDEFGGSFLSKSICSALGDEFFNADIDNDGALDLTDLKKWLIDKTNEHNRLPHLPKIPIPFVFGRERGRFFITLEPKEWQNYQILAANGHIFCLLPCQSNGNIAHLIGTTPVTNQQYRRFVDETGYPEPIGENFVYKLGKRAAWRGPFKPWETSEFSGPDKPVVCVNADDAQAYSRWVNEKHNDISVNLVDTRVWDIAAFGTPYPSFDRMDWLTGNFHHRATAPASVFSETDRENKYGVVDLFGNIWEWTFKGDSEAPRFIVRVFDPPKSTRGYYLRGGSFLDNLEEIDPIVEVAALKDHIKTRHSDLGFRLSASMPINRLPTDIAKRIVLERELPSFRFDSFPSLE